MLLIVIHKITFHNVPFTSEINTVRDFLLSMNHYSIIITWKYSSWATNFTKTIFSLFHEILRYPQKCNISSRLHRQLTCSTGIEGKHSRTKLQKNQAHPSKLETCPQFLVKSLSSLMDFMALKVLLKILASFFLTTNLNLPPFFPWAHEVSCVLFVYKRKSLSSCVWPVVSL